MAKKARGSKKGRSTKKKVRSTQQRERISPKGNTRFAKRTKKGRFKEMDDASRSLSQDRRKPAKKKTKSGYGDQGDNKRGGGGGRRGGKKR